MFLSLSAARGLDEKMIAIVFRAFCSLLLLLPSLPARKEGVLLQMKCRDGPSVTTAADFDVRVPAVSPAVVRNATELYNKK